MAGIPAAVTVQGNGLYQSDSFSCLQVFSDLAAVGVGSPPNAAPPCIAA